jgi:hypothetical protein
MAQLWRMIYDVDSTCSTNNIQLNNTYEPEFQVEYWKDKIQKERESYRKSLSILQKENEALRAMVKSTMREAKSQQTNSSPNISLDGNHCLIVQEKLPQQTLFSMTHTLGGHCIPLTSENLKEHPENIPPNNCDTTAEVIRSLREELDSNKVELSSLTKQIQAMAEEKKLLRSKCKSHIVKLNEKISEQDKIIKSLEREVFKANQRNVEQLQKVNNASSISDLLRVSETHKNANNWVELQMSILEGQMMRLEEVNALDVAKREIRDAKSTTNQDGSEQDMLCVLGLLQDKYDKLKEAFKNSTKKLSDKVKSLQSALLVKTDEIKNQKHQNKQLESRIQTCQKDFGAIKAKLIGMRDDQAKYLSQYESKIVTLKGELSEKNKELDKLQVVIKHDHERFLRMKSSIHKIVELNKTSTVSQDRGSLHEEMHRIYIEEIHKRFDEQEIQDLSELSMSLSLIKKSLHDDLVATGINDEGDHQHLDQAYQAALRTIDTLAEDIQFNESNCGKLVSDQLLRLANALEEKSKECRILENEVRILKDRLHQMEFRCDTSGWSRSWEWLSEGPDMIGVSMDMDQSKARHSSSYTLRIIELETKITQLQQEISTLSRLTPTPTPIKSEDLSL